jgi:hypothetical protein
VAFVFDISSMIAETSSLARATTTPKMPSLENLSQLCSAKLYPYWVTLVASIWHLSIEKDVNGTDVLLHTFFSDAFVSDLRPII